MPENYVGVSDADGDKLQVTTAGALNAVIASQPIGMYAQSNPLLTGTYLFSVEDQAGVVASNTFLTIFNPVGSGRNYVTSASFVSCVAGAAASSTKNMRAYRIAAAPSGGTVQGLSAICKVQTSFRDTNAVIRVGPGITATLGAPFSATPPPVTTGAGGSQFVHTIALPVGSPAFLVAPGEGVAFNTAAGDTDQSWSITIAWAELDV